MSGGVFVLLFRGINVAGNKIAKMQTLREVLTDAGFGKVATYIQSGNVVLKSGKSAKATTEEVEAVFAATFGFSSRVSVRSLDEWRGIVNANPFPQGADDPKKLHAVMLDEAPDDGAAGRLEALASESERFRIEKGVLYLYTPDGFGISKLAAGLDKALKVPLTARNWRTVLTLLDMAEAASH